MNAPVDVPAWLRPSQGEFLTPEELAILTVLFDGILPADHARQIPGAIDVGGADFVSRLLAPRQGDPEVVYWEVPAWRQLYRSVLRGLDQWSTNTHGVSLKSLDPGKVVALLGQLEIGAVAGLPTEFSQKDVFKTLRRHCIQGCFSDPRWGGNRDMKMWRAMGYAQPAEDLYP